MPRTLVVTNDFPPRTGGIEAFVLSLCRALPPDEVVVYTAAMPGDRDFDATLPFPVVRDRSGTLLPTARVSRAAAEVFRGERCDRVLFGAAAPLGLLAPGLRGAGAVRIVAVTHGHETWWARLPGPRLLLRRIGDAVDVLTYLGEYTRAVIGRALSPAARARMRRLSPGVDVAAFRPGAGDGRVRAELGIPADAPVACCVARLVPRKGQDTLIGCWPQVARAVPGAVLLLVGGGPYRATLDRSVARSGQPGAVRFAGRVPWAQVPAYTAAGDVFALPCRTRLLGLEPEAFGICFLEAQACGLPVLVGRSGGAPDTVRDGVTGYVVEPRDPLDITARLVELLTDRSRARAMGAAGRAWMAADWTWDGVGRRLRTLLAVP